MNLLRGVGRLLLGSFFVVNGVKAIKDPAPFALAAQPVADKLVPFAKKALPTEAASYVPEDTETLIRANGAAAVLGGLGMATGLGRRGGAYLAALSMVPHVMALGPRGTTSEERDARRSLMTRNLALLGAALVASQDTAGKPGLAWRAGDARKRLAHSAELTQRSLAKDVTNFRRQAGLQARLAQKSVEAKLP